MALSGTHKYKAIEITRDREFPPGVNVNDYCFMHSGQYRELSGQTKKSGKGFDVDLYLKLKGEREQSIYLKFRTANISKGESLLSYDNLCRLGLKAYDQDKKQEINISAPKNYVFKRLYRFMYLCKNKDVSIRLPMQIAIISLAIGIISLVLGGISLVISLKGCWN